MVGRHEHGRLRQTMCEGQTVTPDKRPAVLNELLNRMPKLEGALCNTADIDPNLWFPESKPEWIAARKNLTPICAECPVKINCLEFALENFIFEGMWAGTTPMERRNIMSDRGANNKKIRMAQMNLDEVRRLMRIGMTQERACAEVGIDPKSYQRYIHREANNWTQ